MFGWLQKLFEPSDSQGADGGDEPTRKQKNYARMLGIPVTPGMTKFELGLEISRAEADDPRLEKERLRKKHREEVVEEKEYWQDVAEQNKWLIATWESGSSTKSEVLRVNGAHIDKSGNVKIECEVAKLKKDRHIGEYIDFGRYVEIRVDRLVRSEVINEIEMTDVRTFRWAADRA